MIEVRKVPKQARSKQKVAHIIEVASNVLVDDGWKGFSTNRVAKAAGVNIASLYQYFPNKEALVYAINRKMLDEVLLQIQGYEAQLDQLSYSALHHAIIQTLQNDARHIQLVRELDHALFENEDLQSMEKEHAESLAQFYRRVLSHYGSKWPAHRLLNTGRLLYQMLNFGLYDMVDLSAEDREESMELLNIALLEIAAQALGKQP
jgi:AcrR family transcriptional regulator